MSQFSKRYGYMPLKGAFQRESLDLPPRTKLWNVLKVTVWDRYDPEAYGNNSFNSRISDLVNRLWFHLLNFDLDALPALHGQYGRKGAYDLLKEHFFACEWFGVYDFIEQVSCDASDLVDEECREWFNTELERHNSAYRFVGIEIAEITDKNEINAIEGGLDDAEAPVKLHLSTALRMLSDRDSPDYRNSVKESISAVEAACRLITKNSSASLGDALKQVNNLHPAMSKAFSQLYGYTSDASGVRHSLIGESTITYADAKFMLVACSAFVSFLKLSSGSSA